MATYFMVDFIARTHVKVGDFKFFCIFLKLKIRNGISAKSPVQIVDIHFIRSVEKSVSVSLCMQTADCRQAVNNVLQANTQFDARGY